MSKCEECNEYDKENFYCPKWCEVIKGTIEDVRADERQKFAEWVDKSYIPRNVGYEYLIKQYISETMKGGAKVAGLNPKCGSCKWLNKEKKTSVGYVCENPNKKWRTSTAHLKPKHCKACKEYEKKDYSKKGGTENG